VFCPSNVGKPGTPEAERQWMDAGVWRYHPTRRVFEVFTEGGSNPWGIDFNETGQLFAEMCVIPHFWEMIHGARIERQGGDTVGADERALRQRQGQTCPSAHLRRHKTARRPRPLGRCRGPHAGNAQRFRGRGHAHAGMLCYLGKAGRRSMGNLFMATSTASGSTWTSPSAAAPASSAGTAGIF
jgi:hypothetical protein